jgi:hypothetical protein
VIIIDLLTSLPVTFAVHGYIYRIEKMSAGLLTH